MKASELLALDDAAIDAMNIDELKSLLKVLLQGYKDLYAQVHKTIHNSNKSSGQEMFNKTSNRQSTGKKPGGQQGHPGTTLEQKDNPDKRVYVRGIGKGQSRMQVIDIVPPRLTCVEYVCNENDIPLDAEFIEREKMPVYVQGSVQYGPHLKTYVLYMKNHMMCAYEKIQDLLREFYGLSISVATLISFDKSYANSLQGWYENAKKIAIQQQILHVDETGIRVAGKNGWMHTASNTYLSVFGYHTKRGKEAMDSIGISPSFTGVAVHDFWKSYFDYTAMDHAMCNAHLLRELQGVIDYESVGKERAMAMTDVLLQLKKELENSSNQNRIQELFVRYDSICQTALLSYPLLKRQGVRGKIKQLKGKNLLDRFIQYKPEITRFAYDKRVPFTNNQAERDIRMNKVKMKISGCFRSADYAQHFAVIRSFFETVRKQGLGLVDCLMQQLICPSSTIALA